MLRTLATLAALTTVTAAGFSRVSTQDLPETTRIGTYDNRSIAIAYAASRFNPVAEQMKLFEAAKEAGDRERQEELEAWGERHQRDLHRQGFGRVPVDDLLAHVADRLPEVARAHDLDAIAWFCDHAGPGVELVDVTDALVALYDPSEKTLRWAREIREKEPVGLDDIERGHGH